MAGLALLVGLLAGCENERSEPLRSSAAPTFSVWGSEHLSWSAFAVAEERGLIDGAAGEMGALETKHNIDIEFHATNGDTPLDAYASGRLDAVCTNNIDILPVAMTIDSVAVLPLSSSDGTEAVIVTNDVVSVADLEGIDVFGQEKGASDYTFRRGLQVLGEEPDMYSFRTRSQEAAAAAMQAGDVGVKAICVRGPYVSEVLEARQDVKVLFDSSLIPGEIVDMIVVRQDSLGRNGADRFVRVLAEAYYAITADLKNANREQTLAELGARPGGRSADEIRFLTERTRYYDTPEQAVELFTTGPIKTAMDRVVMFAIDREIVGQPPTVGYTKGDDLNLRIDASYVDAMIEKPLPDPG